jgi:hypothetical protein
MRQIRDTLVFYFYLYCYWYYHYPSIDFKYLNDINKSIIDTVFEFELNIECMMYANINILILSVFNHDELYDKMYEKNMEYLDTMNETYGALMHNIRFYYVRADSECTAPVLNESNRMLTIPGTESWCPGILKKTIAGFRFFSSGAGTLNFYFDYVVRTNASTFIDLEGLYNELSQVHLARSIHALDASARCPYIAMGHVSTLASDTINYRYGLTEDSMNLYRNERFFQGVCIIMNRALYNDLVDHSATSINYNIVDDVELGHFIFSYDRGPDSPNSLHVVDLKQRMISYYVDDADAIRPFIFCNNRYKAWRYNDLRSFCAFADKYINDARIIKY